MDDIFSTGKEELISLGKTLLRGSGGGPISAVKEGYGSFINNTKENTNLLLRLFRACFRKDEVDALPGDAPKDSRERFAYAARLYGRNEAYIRQVQDNKYRLFSLFFAAAVSILGIDIATWYSYISSPIYILAHISPIIPLAINAFVCSFYNWQARTRRLESFGEFLKHPTEWWPVLSPDSSRNGTGKSVAGIILLVSAGISALIVGTAPGAMAQSAASSAGNIASNPSALFQALPSTDLWGNLLGFAFPGIGPINSSPTPLNNAIASAFGTLIACLMALGAAMISYDTLTSTVDVAHDGSLLNRKWHTIWSPVRVAYGMASLAPIVQGYCLLQVAVIWGAVISGNIGNAMWSAFVDNIGSGTLSAPMVPQTIVSVSNIMTEEVCYAFLNQNYQNQKQANPGLSTPPPQRDSTYQNVTSQSGWFSTVASSLTSLVSSSSPPQTIQWSYGDCGTVSGKWDLNGSGGSGAFAAAQVNAVNSLRQQLQPIATALVQSFMPGSNSGNNTDALWQQFVGARNSYAQQLNAAAQNYVDVSSTNTGMRGAGQNSLSAFQQTMSSQGWAIAGASYMAISRINAKEIGAMQSTPTVSDDISTTQDMQALMEQGGADIMLRFTDWMKKNLTMPNNGFDQQTVHAAIQALRAGDMHENSQSLYQGLQYMLSSDSDVQQFLMNLVSIQPSQMDGLQQMVNLGDYIVGTSETILALYIGANLAIKKFIPGTSAVNTIKNLFTGGGGSPLSFGVLFFGMLATAIFAAGVYDSLILPMLPFTHFTFAVMGMLVTVIEGVVAAPIWAFMHVRMAGEEFIQSEQRAGYQLFFNLIFRIPLTLLGLFFSILVFNAMMWLMAQTIFPAMAAATAESLFGVVSTVVMIVFISVLNYQIASRSFLLINQIPDRVTRWFGAADHSDESHHVNAIIGAVSGGASKAIEAGGGAYRGTFMTKPGTKAGGGEKTSGGKTDNTNTHSDIKDTGEVNADGKTSEEKVSTATIT